MDKHVFISYQHDDNDFAENLIQRVQAAGLTTWIDADGLNAGDPWRETIDQAIRNAFALIVIMSPTAKASEYVTYEWAFAWGCGIKVIPVMYKKTELHPRLESLQFMDFTERRNRPWDKLMKVLKRAASELSPPEVPVVPETFIEQKAQKWIEKGYMFLEREDYIEAEEAFERAIQADPGDARGYIGRGELLLRLYHFEGLTLESFREASLLDPNNADAYVGKSEVLYRGKDYSEALKAAERAISLGANTARAWVCKGKACQELKRYEEALSAYEQALKLDPEFASIWKDKGNILNYLKRYEEALSAYEQALKLNPGHAFSWSGKGNALHNLGSYDEALVAYEEALKLESEDAVIWHNKGNTFTMLGRSLEADECYQKARESGYKEEDRVISHHV